MESNVKLGHRRHRVKKAKTWPARVPASLLLINSIMRLYANGDPTYYTTWSVVMHSEKEIREQIIIVPLLVHAASTMIIKLRITHEKYEGISRLMWQEDFLGRPSMRRINVFKLVTLFPRYIFADGSEFRTVCNNKQQGPINLATSFSSDHSTLSKAFHNV
jgi:hypothetical protein